MDDEAGADVAGAPLGKAGDVLTPVHALAAHPLSGALASGGGDGLVAVWDTSAKASRALALALSRACAHACRCAYRASSADAIPPVCPRAPTRSARLLETAAPVALGSVSARRVRPRLQRRRFGARNRHLERARGRWGRGGRGRRVGARDGRGRVHTEGAQVSQGRAGNGRLAAGCAHTRAPWVLLVFDNIIYMVLARGPPLGPQAGEPQQHSREGERGGGVESEGPLCKSLLEHEGGCAEDVEHPRHEHGRDERHERRKRGEPVEEPQSGALPRSGVEFAAVRDSRSRASAARASLATRARASGTGWGEHSPRRARTGEPAP